MSIALPQYPEYLQTPNASVWQWVDCGLAIEWTAYGRFDASTAIFTPELHQILISLNKRLAKAPSLTFVLFVVDAMRCRDLAATHMRLVDLLAENQAPEAETPFAQNWLKSLADVMADREASTDWIVDVVAYVIQSADVPSEVTSLAAWDALSYLENGDGSVDLAELPVSKSAQSQRLHAFCDTLRRAMQVPIECERIERFAKSGVIGDPPPIEDLFLDDDSTGGIGKSLRRLSGDERYGEMAQIAIGLSSLLSLPRRVSDPAPLNVGGVSDIANRGKPQNLLMTELAAEPMLLAARIAHGQALYVRRESPPSPTPRVRPLAIESSIRCWGVRRLMLAATALAVAASEADAKQIHAVTVDGETVHEENLQSFEGVTTHLERLSIQRQPSAALDRWLKTLQISSASGGQDALGYDEPLVVITEATRRDNDFQTWLRTCSVTFLIAEIDENSTLRLKRHSPMGMESIQQIDLKSCIAKHQAQRHRPAAAGLPIERHDESSSVLFLDVSPQPLRFGTSGNEKWRRAVPDVGVFMILPDGRLVLYDRPGIGARCLIERLPGNQVLGFQCHDDQFDLLIARNFNLTNWFRGSLDGDDFSMTELSHIDGRCHFVFDRGDLFRVDVDVRQLSPVTGEASPPTTIPLGRKNHLGGPVFKYRDGLYVVVGGPTPTAIKLVDQRDLPIVVDMAYRDPNDVIVLATSCHKEFVCFVDQPDGSPFKHEVLHSRPEAGWVQICQGTAELLSVAGKFMMPRHGKPPWVQPRSTMHRISRVVCSSGGIHLVKGNRLWTIKPVQTNDSRSLTLVRERTTGSWGFSRDSCVELPAVRSVMGDRTRSDRKLKQFTGGVCHAFIDARGMLHLRRDDDPHELTLVLCEPQLSGWVSWGETFGERYFTGRPDCGCPEKVRVWLERFVSTAMDWGRQS
ncbi:MAG: hypothetical protein AAF958_18720 [Planctomycetota bacterium]